MANHSSRSSATVREMDQDAQHRVSRIEAQPAKAGATYKDSIEGAKLQTRSRSQGSSVSRRRRGSGAPECREAPICPRDSGERGRNVSDFVGSVEEGRVAGAGRSSVGAHRIDEKFHFAIPEARGTGQTRCSQSQGGVGGGRCVPGERGSSLGRGRKKVGSVVGGGTFDTFSIHRTARTCRSHRHGRGDRLQALVDSWQQELAQLRGDPIRSTAMDDDDVEADLPHKKSRVGPFAQLAITGGVAPKTPLAVTGVRAQNSKFDTSSN